MGLVNSGVESRFVSSGGYTVVKIDQPLCCPRHQALEMLFPLVVVQMARSRTFIRVKVVVLRKRLYSVK